MDCVIEMTELTNDAWVREYVVETVANRGLVQMANHRDDLTATPRGVSVPMDACRDAAARLFAVATDTLAVCRVPAPARAGVAAVR
jgi:hypothetical protein